MRQGKQPPTAISSDSNSQSNRDRLAAQEIARYLNSNPSEKLRAWVRQRSEPFSLPDAAHEALGMPPGRVRREISTRIGIILTQEIGCLRFRRKSSVIQFWYSPPQEGAKQ